MSKNPIDEYWREIEQSGGFCCDQDREAARIMFFAGAMAALEAMTGWNPEAPGVLCIHTSNIAVVSAELTARWQSQEAEAIAIRSGLVGHA